jgi:hypothetical protein
MRRLDHVPPLSRGCLCFDRFEEFRSAEEDARRRATYESVKSARDALALELRELYPSFHERLADLFQRMDANNTKLTHVNRCLPRGKATLLEAELVARKLDSFVRRGMTTPSIVREVRLAPFEYSETDRWAYPSVLRPW